MVFTLRREFLPEARAAERGTPKRLGKVVANRILVEPYAHDFEADVECELSVLGKLVPIVTAAQKPPTAMIYLDGRPGRVEISYSATVGMSFADFVEYSDLRPLLFGSAWKIVDILIEHELSKSPAIRKKHYFIAEKVAAARTGNFCADPFRSMPHLWDRVCAAYVLAEQYRHSISHRRVTVDQTGAFVGEDPAGAALRPMSVDEQLAFCKAVQRVATAVIRGAIDSREQKILLSLLDTLSSLTGMPMSSASCRIGPTPVVTVPISKTDDVNMVDVKARITGLFPAVHEADVIFDVTDEATLRFFARLEDIPDVTLALDASVHEPWLVRI